MQNRTAYALTLLLLVQAMAATLSVVPMDANQEEWQGPVFESGARSNNSSSGCGSNVNYTSVYASAPYMVMENQSFTTSVYVNCELLNATMLVDYWIYDSSNSTVFSGNQSWNGTSSSSSNFTSSVSGLSVGNYTFHADLYVDGTLIDSDSDSFMVYTNNSGGGGNNGGNQTSPCGSNVNYTYVSAYAPYMVMENQSFSTSVYVNCQILNATMLVDYWIYDTNNNTVFSGNQSWNGTTTTSSNFNSSVSGLSAGYYVFHADLYVDGTWVDSDADSFMVYANSSGGGGNNGGNNTSSCGDNVSDVWFEVSPYQEEWNASDTVSVYLDTYCGIWNNSYMVSWGLIDNANNSTIEYGSTSFMTTPSSVTYHPNHTYHFNEVDIHLHYMEPGNYTVFGHFSVLMNNSWTLLSNQSSTFVVNSTMTTTVCGFNSTFVGLETGLQSTLYSAGSSVHPWSDVECPMLNTMYTYTWEMYNQNTSTITHSGLQNFTATWQNVNMFPDGSGFYYDLYPHAYNLTEGTYLLNTTLLSASGELIDASLVSFTVLANPSNNTGGNNTGGNNTGGNNTGGNNTGGNNTGGNNTGGNNTGGNNTGGNNTGGNNTGGNNTGCPGLSPSGLDGVIDIVNVSTAYAQGDLVNAYVDLCWSPYLSNTSMWFSVWLNDSSGFTVQDWGIQGSTWFPAWEQGIDYGEGHWVFSLRHLPISGAWNLSIDSLAPNETYCFEGNLKVFDNTIGAFVWVDDATPMCFSTPQTNNTGGNTGDETVGYCYDEVEGNVYSGADADTMNEFNCTGPGLVWIPGNDDDNGGETGGNNTGGNNTGDETVGYCYDEVEDSVYLGSNANVMNEFNCTGPGLVWIPGNDDDNGGETGGNNTGGNNTVLDTDGDGVDDTIDNCPFVANLDQADADDDGIGTACDEDESSSSEESDSVPSIGLLATSLCMLGAAILVRRD